MKRIFIQKYKPLDFKFYQNVDDFVVVEEPIAFANRGNFIILKIKKVNLGTWDLIEKVAKGFNIYENEIGYAGLKDKNATTTQYLSIPKKYAKDVKKFKHGKIEIVETFLHGTKLNIGDLKGNTFEINLHEVKEEDVGIIEKRLKEIAKAGMPNFFGFQRFGKDIKENLEKAQKVIYGDLKIKDRKLEKMLISAYQSDFFNRWLAKRLLMSKEKFDLLGGDVMMQLSDEKFFTPKNITEKIQSDYDNHKIVPTGLLSGRNVFKSMGEAGKIEQEFDDTYIQEKGLRRAAVVFPRDISVNYNKEEQKCKLRFTLPKGAYATVLIENIGSKYLRS
ncbi:MAG: tRNA pseudouridine(13) synthase TruD [Candidatus Marinarcus sp.]|uniref:tRNA pseudouridine(13) synthase TruD n=1 Tax=Candidatus Marinarcus sp. TaxID=3100987 RepID=UPI003AFF76AC